MESQYKECGVVMLNTKSSKLLLSDDGQLFHYHKEQIGEGIIKPQHLYITSDDKIKDGDWMININGDTIIKYDSKNEGDNTWREYWRKIIATTDKLCIGHEDDYDERSKTGGNPIWLPEPSDKFIQAYIDAYNKGEKIDKVLVEMDYEYYSGGTTFFTKLKDNDIIIKKTKDSWTKDELLSTLSLESLREKFHSQSGMFINKQTSHEIIQWIKDSL